jgi:hypothetical protein
MEAADSSFISLRRHPDTPSGAARRVAARAEWSGADSLRLGYLLEGDLGRIRIPAPAREAGRADRLWAHTCFEAFVRIGESPQYLELNFSPSSEWAAYRFASYREGMSPAVLAEVPRLVLRRSGDRLELEAEVCLRGALPVPGEPVAGAADGPIRARMALSAVVEDREGSLSYFALCHPPGRPDFHHPDGFSLAQT